MNDPKRLRETHASELEGLLLESVRADTPSSSARARTLAAVAIGVAAGGAAIGAAGSASAGVPAGKVGWVFVTAKWLAVGAGAGAVVAGTLVGPLHGLMEEHSAPSRAGSNPARIVAPSRGRVAAPPPAVAGNEPAEPRGTEPAVSSSGARIATAGAVPVERVAPVVAAVTEHIPDGTASLVNPKASTNTLPEEVAFLDATSRALRENDPARAHASLDAYAARFGVGNLGPEATALRIEAFLEQGDRLRAEQIAGTFLARNPHSPHAARLRALLGIRVAR